MRDNLPRYIRFIFADYVENPPEFHWIYTEQRKLCPSSAMRKPQFLKLFQKASYVAFSFNTYRKYII